MSEVEGEAVAIGQGRRGSQLVRARPKSDLAIATEQSGRGQVPKHLILCPDQA